MRATKQEKGSDHSGPTRTLRDTPVAYSSRDTGGSGLHTGRLLLAPCSGTPSPAVHGLEWTPDRPLPSLQLRAGLQAACPHLS